jgi:ABC-type transport system substrate-binding protein
MYVYSSMHSESGANYTGFSDPELDRLLGEAIGGADDPAAAWAAVQEQELTSVPLIPTVTARYVEAYSDRLEGHEASSLFSLRDLDRAWVNE